MTGPSETSKQYPYLWQSQCEKVRVIRCKGDLQNIVQAWQSPKWRNLSYHTDWNSISRRWVELNIPDVKPSRVCHNLPDDELNLVCDIMGL
jgi:hypothetical protein